MNETKMERIIRILSSKGYIMWGRDMWSLTYARRYTRVTVYWDGTVTTFKSQFSN